MTDVQKLAGKVGEMSHRIPVTFEDRLSKLEREAELEGMKDLLGKILDVAIDAKTLRMPHILKPTHRSREWGGGG